MTTAARGASIGLVLLAAGAALAAGPSGTPVVITSDADCAVYVDGELVHAALKANATHRTQLAPGEHLVTAECVGGARFKQVVEIGATQKVIQIEAKAASPPAPAPTPGAAQVVDPSVRAQPGFGLEARDGAVRVTLLRPGSAAERAGIPVGATLLAVDGVTVGGDVGAAWKGLWGAKGSSVTVRVSQAGATTDHSLIRDAPMSPMLSGAPGGVSPKLPTAPAVKPGAQRCAGVATPCSARTSFNCQWGSGCFAGQGSCTGTPMATCLGKPRSTCGTTPGCQWLFNACSGSPSCAGKATQWACDSTLGCSWQEACSGFALPCEMLDDSTCIQQPGCLLQ